MSGGLVTCVKCAHDYGSLEYRACCDLLWATCGRCGFEWSQYPVAQQQPAAQEPLSPEQLKALLQAHREAHPGSFEAAPQDAEAPNA